MRHARTVRFTARPGRAEELEHLLVQVAEGLRGTPGCELWLVSRNPAAPGEVWVQELWASAEAAEAALSAAPSGDGPSPADIMPLLEGPPTRIDLEPLGGAGPPPDRPGE